MSPTFAGSTHDKKICDLAPIKLPEGIEQWQDTGYQGYAPEGVVIIQPTKKPRGKELTPEQKQKNKQISRVRVVVEHAIGGVKILRIVKEEIRIYSEKVRHKVFLIACALHNLKIRLKKLKS